jgi:hypothetical protein
MKLSEISKNVPHLFNHGKSIHLISGPGQGKSQEVETVWPELITKATGKKTICVTVHGTTLEAVDIRGFPVPVKREGMNPVTKFASSPVGDIVDTHMAAEGAEQVIVFIDEFAQAEHIVAKAMAPLILDHRVGDDFLPEGTWVVLASNRAKDRAGANKMLTHVINRVATFDLESDLAGAMNFVSNTGRHPMHAAFINARPGVVFTDEIPKGDRPFPSPRSVTFAFDYMSMVSGKDDAGNWNMQLADDPFTQQVVAGFVGEGASAEMFAFIKVASELPEIEDILDDPAGAKMPSDKRLDAQYAAASLLVHHADAEKIEPLWTYAQRLSKEFQVSIARQLVEKSGGILLNSPALNKWLVSNRALVMGSV